MAIIFPTFYGRPGFPLGKTANWATRMQRAPNGRELRALDYANPIWTFTLIFPFLYDYADCRFIDSGATEFRTILNFYNGCQGAFAAFLFDDPTDDSVRGGLIGTGDGARTVWQLVRQLVPGGFAEEISAPNFDTVFTVYLNGTPISQPGNWSINEVGVLTFTSPPGNGVVITIDFNFYFRCYFTDALDAQEFLHNLWELKQVKLTSIPLNLKPELCLPPQ